MIYLQQILHRELHGGTDLKGLGPLQFKVPHLKSQAQTSSQH